MKFKRWIATISTVMSICIVMSGCSKSENTLATIVTEKSVNLLTITQESYSDFLSYSGYVAAKDTKNFSFQLGGKVTEVNAEKGESVKAGQILAKLDTKDVQMAIDNANESILLANNGIEQTQSAIDKINIGIEAERINLNKIDAGIEAEKINQKNIETSIEADKLTLKKIQDEYDTKINQLEISYNLKKNDFERIKSLFEAQAASQQDYDNAKSAFDSISKDYDNAKTSRENDINLQNKSIESKENNLEIEKINIKNLMNDRQLQETKIRDLENDLQRVRLELEAAQIKVKQANIQLEQSTKQLNDSTLVSTIDGYVLELGVKAGEVTGAGTPVVIVKGGEQIINVGIPVEDYNKVRVGMNVSMEFNDEKFNGTVNTVSLYPDEATRTYNIEILPDKKDLVTGTLITVKIPIDDRDGYFVPITAVGNENGMSYIYTLEKNTDDDKYTVHRTEVELGNIYGQRVLLKNIDSDIDIIPEDIKDIKENDIVIVAE